MSQIHKTRLAPSPTGALHLGNARTFLLNWLLARQRGWKVLFRMEDLDGPRTKPGADKQAINELAWLGLDWEGEILVQSTRSKIYESALKSLAAEHTAYPCICSRKEVEAAASAPTSEEFGENYVVYQGTCRGRYKNASHAQQRTDRPVAWRVRVRDKAVEFDDGFAGHQSFNLMETCGDFVVFRSHGLAAYQLAVTVDDYDSGVDVVVRGDDLLLSAAIQIHLRRLLGLVGKVEYWHLPLVIGADGRKLAKRHGDTKITTYIEAGATPQRMLGLLGFWSGIFQKPQETDIETLIRKFDIEKLSKEPIVFSPNDDAFLRGK
jgi:glutamyl-tRNA synthetase